MMIDTWRNRTSVFLLILFVITGTIASACAPKNTSTPTSDHTTFCDSSGLEYLVTMLGTVRELIVARDKALLLIIEGAKDTSVIDDAHMSQYKTAMSDVLDRIGELLRIEAPSNLRLVQIEVDSMVALYLTAVEMEALAQRDVNAEAFMRAQEVFQQTSSHADRIVELANDYLGNC